jgi:hypothetical protein
MLKFPEIRFFGSNGSAGAAVALALVAALHLPGAEAASPAPVDAAISTLERAMDGDDSAVDPAAKEFARLLAASPGDPFLMVYLGAATALRANTTWLPWKKLAYAEDGLAYIDKAVALLTPGDDAPRADGTFVALETRFVAASTFLSLPGMFNRRARGEQMLKDVLANPQLAQAPMSLRGAVWLRAGLQAIDDKRDKDARRWLQQVVDANTPQAATARAKLKELGS